MFTGIIEATGKVEKLEKQGTNVEGSGMDLSAMRHAP